MQVSVNLSKLNLANQIIIGGLACACHGWEILSGVLCLCGCFIFWVSSPVAVAARNSSCEIRNLGQCSFSYQSSPLFAHFPIVNAIVVPGCRSRTIIQLSMNHACSISRDKQERNWSFIFFQSTKHEMGSSRFPPHN